MLGDSTRRSGHSRHVLEGLGLRVPGVLKVCHDSPETSAVYWVTV